MHHLNKWIVQRRSSVRKREGLSTSEAAAAVSAIEAEPLLLPSLAVAPPTPLYLFYTSEKLDIRKKRRKIYVLSFSMLKALGDSTDIGSD